MPDVALVLFPPQKDDLSSASGADGFRAWVFGVRGRLGIGARGWAGVGTRTNSKESFAKGFKIRGFESLKPFVLWGFT